VLANIHSRVVVVARQELWGSAATAYTSVTRAVMCHDSLLHNKFCTHKQEQYSHLLRPPVRQNSGTSTPRTRPPATTLNIPGMTRSKVSPDGRIASRDVASKLVVIMVGLPARGKSYITKKIQRYLSWQQHNSRIFNVGNRRRVAAGVLPGPVGSAPSSPQKLSKPLGVRQDATSNVIDPPTQAAYILLNGRDPPVLQEPTTIDLARIPSHELPAPKAMDQSAQFFDPENREAANLREQVALATLDELLDYLLHQDGSVGILDATNSTIERRQLLFKRIKEREPKLGILFIESICEDPKVRSP
jgi:6-phosphofructo-2-kinase